MAPSAKKYRVLIVAQVRQTPEISTKTELHLQTKTKALELQSKISSRQIKTKAKANPEPLMQAF